MADPTTATTGTGFLGTFTAADLERLESEIRAMPKVPWVLIAPDGRLWQSPDPQMLLRVLAGAVAATWPLSVPRLDQAAP